MKRTFPFFVCFSIAAPACGGGGGSTNDGDAGTARGAVTCEVAVDEDVCARRLDGMDEAMQGASRTLLEPALAFARRARDEVRALDAACTGGLADLGVAPAADRPPCEVLVAALRAAPPKVTLDIREPTCEKLAPPACAPPGAPPPSACTGGDVVATVDDGAPEGAKRAAAMFDRRFDLLAGVKDRFDEMASRASQAETALRSARGHADACLTEAADHVKQGVADLRRASEHVSDIVSAAY